jgi:5'-3' exonuclease
MEKNIKMMLKLFIELFDRQFFPMEQLMSVFPAASRSHVPEPWGTLMYDPVSPLPYSTRQFEFCIRVRHRP